MPESIIYSVLRFGYQGFKSLQAEHVVTGSCSINLGDATQSIASRHALMYNKVEFDDISYINRDNLRDHEGPPIVPIVNAVLYRHCFPFSRSIRPLFFGFTAPRSVLTANVESIRAREPVGCRDLATATFLAGLGVRCFVSGCLTLCLPTRASAPEGGKVLIVYGRKAGALPSQLLRRIPHEILDEVEMVDHRLLVWNYPLGPEEMAKVERIEEKFLARYASEARLVITPLHHVAAPCMAMGIPVVLARHDADERFSLLSKLIQLYTPDRFDEIDWAPKPANLLKYKSRQLETLDLMMRAESQGALRDLKIPFGSIFDI